MRQNSQGSAFENHLPYEANHLFTELTPKEMSSFSGGKSLWKKLLGFFESPFRKAPLAPRSPSYWLDR